MIILERIFGKTKRKLEETLSEKRNDTNISDRIIVMNIPEKQIEKWNIDRRKIDNVEELMKHDGFHFKPIGRSGTIYYVEKGKLCEIQFEMSGESQFDVLLFFEEINEWVIPVGEHLTLNKKNEIREKLLIWLKKKRLKSDL